MIFKRMREQILDKAIRGQLVPQLAEDGVVEQIGEAPAEVPFEIPQSWKWGTLENYVTINPSTSKLDDNTEVSFLPMASVYPGFVSDFDREESKLWVNAKKGFSKFANGDVLLAKISPCFENRKSCIVHNLINGFGAGSTELIAMRPTELIYANYLLWYVKTKYVIDYCSITFKGTVGQQRINPDRFKSMPIPVPPLAEQKRIAAKIESLFDEINRAEKAYEELQSLANVLRGQILQKAIQGKLVPQLPEDGVVDQIGNAPEEVPFEIPASWCWSVIKDVADVKGGKRVPTGKKLVPHDTGYPYIRVSDMQNGSVNLDSILYLTEETRLQIKNYTISCKDVYVTVAGTIGRVGTVPKELDGANLTENADKIVLNNNGLLRDWVLCFLKSEFCQQEFKAKTTKVGQPKLAIKRIENICIPIPPIAEQKRIVEKVETLLEQIDLMTK